MIYKLTEEWAVRPIAEMIMARPDVFKIKYDVLIKYLLQGVKDENSVIIVDEKDKTIRGFIFASIEEFNGEDVCFIHSCVIEPMTGDNKTDSQLLNCGHEMLEKLRKWSVEHKVVGENKLIISADPSKLNFYRRRYKFDIVGLLLARDVLTDEQKEEKKNVKFFQKQTSESRVSTAGSV